MTYVSYKACTPSIQPKNWNISNNLRLSIYVLLRDFIFHSHLALFTSYPLCRLFPIWSILFLSLYKIFFLL